MLQLAVLIKQGYFKKMQLKCFKIFHLNRTSHKVSNTPVVLKFCRFSNQFLTPIRCYGQFFSSKEFKIKMLDIHFSIWVILTVLKSFFLKQWPMFFNEFAVVEAWRSWCWCNALYLILDFYKNYQTSQLYNYNVLPYIELFGRYSCCFDVWWLISW